MNTSLEAGNPNTSETSTAQRNAMNIMRLLRISGVVILLVAAYQFIMRDVVGDNILGSYYTFLGFTIALAAGGWFCAKRWKDSAGGRTLLGLTAIILPVHLAQHAAFIYARYQGLTDSTWYIGYGELTLLMGVSVPILIATTWLGYAGWLRKLSSTLAPLYIIMNFALLLPFRDPDFIAIQVLLMAIPSIVIVGNLSKKHSILRSPEGIIARLAFIPPIAVLVGRNLVEVEGSYLLLSLVLVTLGVVCNYTIVRECKMKGTRNVFRVFGIINFLAAFSLTLNTNNLITEFLPEVPGYVQSLLFLSLTYSILMVRAEDTRNLRSVTILLVTITLGFFTLLDLFDWIGFIAIAIGLISVVIGFHMRELFELVNGTFMILFGVIYYAVLAISQHDSISWIALAGLGLAVVIGASFLEGRKFTWHQLKARTQETFEDWN